MGAVAVALLVVFAQGPTPGGTSDDRLYAIAGELKCLQCVGESVGSSQSPLARQFRDEIRDQMEQGASDGEILDFFAERYGDEVLLTPVTSGAGALVWVLPLLFIAGAGYGGYVLLRGRGDSVPVAEAADDAVGRGAVGRNDSAGTRPARLRRPAVVASVLGFAVLLGLLLWWGASDRGSGNITGEDLAGGSAGDCATLGMDLEAGIDCWSEVLAGDPDNVEALAYRGWLASRAGDTESAAEDLDRALELDPAYPDALVFSAVLALDQLRIDDARALLDDFFASDPPNEMRAIVNAQLLEEKLYLAGLSEPARQCWLAAAEGGLVSAGDSESLGELGGCANEALKESPDDVDLKLSAALAGLGGEEAAVAESLRIAQEVLSADPDNPDALSIAVVALVRSGAEDEAEAMLESVESSPRAPVAWVVGDAVALRELVESASATKVPNPDGG